MFNRRGGGVGREGGGERTRRTVAAAPPSPSAARRRVLEMGNVFQIISTHLWGLFLLYAQGDKAPPPPSIKLFH